MVYSTNASRAVPGPAGSGAAAATALYSPPESRRRWARKDSVPTIAVTTVVAFLVLYPLFELLRRPFGNLGELWSEAIEIPHIGTTLLNTLILGAASMMLATIAAVALAYCRANLTGRLGRAAQVIAIVPLVIPPLSGVVGWAFLLSPRVGYLNQLFRELPFLDHLRSGPTDIYTLPWIVIITGIYLIPYAFIFIQAGLSNVDTRLEDAARSSGASWVRTQVDIVLPLLRPTLIYGGGIVALLALGQFTAALLLGRTEGIDVITTQLYRLTAEPPPNYALATFIALPVLLISLAGIAAQRLALRGNFRFMMSGKGVGRARGHHPILFIPVIVYSFLMIIPPLAGLIIVALSPFWGRSIKVDQFSFAAFDEVFSDAVSTDAIVNSLTFAVTATLICLALSLAAALVALRTTGLSRKVIDYVVNVPIAVPAILFGMGFFVSLGLGPITVFLRENTGINLYGSTAIIVLAYVVLILPHGTRLMMSGITQINPQLESAARVAGSTAFGAVMRILVPLLRRNVASAAMLMFILCSHEFAASALLVGPDTQVMSTVLFGQWDTGTYPRVAALALVMVAISVTGLIGIVMFDRPGRVRAAAADSDASANGDVK